MERLHHVKEIILDEILNQVSHLECVNTKELGEAIDMIKDLEEAIYYGTITKAMHGEWPKETDMMPDGKAGRSHMTRRMYMEAKELHHDKTSQIQNLEQYMKELSMDVVEMIQGSSPEEKQLLKSKLTTLISKIDHA